MRRPQIAPTHPNEQRRSQRVMLDVTISIQGLDFAGDPFQEFAHTESVNAHGALVMLEFIVRFGEILSIRHETTEQTLLCKVARIADAEDGGAPRVGLEFLRPSPYFWGISFPPPDWEALTNVAVESQAA
jgi:hypothetical protein